MCPGRCSALKPRAGVRLSRATLLEQERAQRDGDLPELHYPSHRARGVGPAQPDPTRVCLHGWAGYRAGQNRGSRAKKRADYLLFFQSNLPLAIVEARTITSPSAGACSRRCLRRDARCALRVLSNGDGFLFHDRTGALDPDREDTRSRRIPITRRPLGAIPA